MNKVEKAIKMLLDTRPFYAHFFLNSKIIYDAPGIDTAAAGISKTSTILAFSTKFLETLTPQETCGLIEHEVLHLLFEHYNMDKSLFDKHIANLAQDLSINQYISVLPPNGVTLDKISSTLGQPLEPFQTWEYYYTKMVAQQDKFVKYVTVDDHDALQKELEKMGMPQHIIKNVMDKAIKASAGNVPEAVLKIYDGLKSEGKVAWQQVLANFVARQLSVTKIPTRKKENRRFGLDQPGKKKKRELTLSVCVDSSGSVSDDSYEQFMTELLRIIRLCNTTYFIDADCEVHNVEIIKKNKKFEPTRRGCGGTAYQPAIDKAMELGSDAIIYFGDFDCADTPTNPGVPFLWVGVGSSPKPGDFGAEIRI